MTWPAIPGAGLEAGVAAGRLDQTVDRIAELDPDRGVLLHYTGGYTDYLEARGRGRG